MAVNSSSGPRDQKIERPSWWSNFGAELFSMETVKGTARNVGDIVTGNAPDNKPADKGLLSRAGETVGNVGASLVDPLLGTLQDNIVVLLALGAGGYLLYEVVL